MVETMDDIIKKIKHAFAAMPAQRCERCRRPRKLFVAERGMCAECCDDVLQLETGCRFGDATCDHEDCRTSTSLN